MRYTLPLLLGLLLFACGEAEPAGPMRDVLAARDPLSSDPNGPGVSPNARPEVLEMLREDRAAARSPGDGGGRAWLAAAPEPVIVRQPGRYELVYEAGPLGIEVGGRVFFHAPSYWDWSGVQMVEPAAPGYTEVSSEAAGVELLPRVVDEHVLEIEIRGRALVAGERLAIVYGAGELGALADRYAERESAFRFAVDADGDGVRGFVADAPAVDVVPGPAAGLVVQLPATARPGAPVTLTSAVLDGYANAGVPFEGALELEASGPIEAAPAPAFAAASGGRLTVEIVPSEAGVLRLTATSGELQAESNPMLVGQNVPRILWADLHGHSNLSDGTGIPEDYYRYAREVAGLDVAVLTDHDHWGIPFLDETPAMWERIRAAALRHHVPGRFVTLLGFEWTNWVHGHRHVLYFSDDGEVLSCVDPETDDPDELWAALRAQGRPALTFAHHSAGGPVATNWRFRPDAELEPVTEIVSVHGASEALDAPLGIYSPVPGNFVRDVIRRGDRLGFVGSGDSHDGHPGLAQLGAASGGLAAIFSEELTREGVLEALRARRVYATNGPRIVLQAFLGGRPMGAVLPPGDHSLRVQVAAVAPLDRIELIRVGGRPFQDDVALVFDPDEARDVVFEHELLDLQAGERVYLRVLQRDGGAAWSSPYFVDAEG